MFNTKIVIIYDWNISYILMEMILCTNITESEPFPIKILVESVCNPKSCLKI